MSRKSLIEQAKTVRVQQVNTRRKYLIVNEEEEPLLEAAVTPEEPIQEAVETPGEPVDIFGILGHIQSETLLADQIMARDTETVADAENAIGGLVHTLSGALEAAELIVGRDRETVADAERAVNGLVSTLHQGIGAAEDVIAHVTRDRETVADAEAALFSLVSSVPGVKPKKAYIPIVHTIDEVEEVADVAPEEASRIAIREDMQSRYQRVASYPYELRFKGLRIYDSRINKVRVVFETDHVEVAGVKYPYVPHMRIINI
jgi:hypothetical protein